MPLIPLRGLIIYPSMVLYFDVGRDKSREALEEAMLLDKEVFLTTQKDYQVEDPTPQQYYHVGIRAKVKQMLKLPGNTIRVLVEGITRAKIVYITDKEKYIEVVSEDIETIRGEEREETAYMRSITEALRRYSAVSQKITSEVLFSIENVDDAEKLADLIAPHLGITIAAKHKILVMESLIDRLDYIYKCILEEMEILELEQDIKSKVKSTLVQSQREYFLKEQMRVIQDELGESEEEEAENFLDRLNKLKLKKEVHQKIEKQIKKLKTLNPASPEHSVTRSYVEWLLDLPWKKSTKETIDLKAAREILDRDHYSMEKVKERIIEYLAVRKLTGNLKGPIICLVGPPGVGKTSIAKSIADSLNRKFVRMSLGGISDEAEIRGHRRTYIGAIPGRIMTLLKEVESKNPLFLLDEIDKLHSNFRGDPASALLEVLDPEQNKTFVDNYLEVPFDLSKVLFLTTANTVSTIPRPLLDRMEIIEVSGYTLYEKMEIAKQYLIPKQLKENGLAKDYDITFSDQAILRLIECFTRESGVRELERIIATVLRKVATECIEQKKNSYKISSASIHKFLGKDKFQRDAIDQEDKVGIVTGLAYTSVGGDTLQIEVNIMKGKGKLSLTGKLGDVMKESAQTGISYIRSIEDELGIDSSFFQDNDIHIHVPEGAVPKDGPSAGVTMATAVVSAITGKKVRGDLAMTGEITLRGRVLPIGGLKEKILAAKRFGIKTVLVPAQNEDSVDEISEMVKSGVEIIFVKQMSEVLERALIDEDKK